MAKKSGYIDSRILQGTAIGSVMQYSDLLSDVLNRSIGRNLYTKSITYKDKALNKNPLTLRYDDSDIKANVSGPAIGEKEKLYTNSSRKKVFLDEIGGLSGFTYNQEGREEYLSENTASKTAMDKVLEQRNLSKNDIETSPYSDFIQDNSGKTGTINPKWEKVNFVSKKDNADLSTKTTIEDNALEKTSNNKFSQEENNGYADFIQESGKTGILTLKNRLYPELNIFRTNSQNENRIWTSANTYNKITKATRNYTKLTNGQNLQEKLGLKNLRPFEGVNRLSEKSVLNNNGLVNITPFKNSDGTLNTDSIKRCMFSIENLAWRDVKSDASIYGTKSKTLSEEQRGPNGGRIMWFPPYNLKFTENVTANWDSNTFIGRGEKIYTYTDTERTGTLNFSILVDHPSVLNKAVNEGVSDEEILKYFIGEGLLETGNETTESEVEGSIDGTYKLPQDIQYEELFTMNMGVFFSNGYSGHHTDEETPEETLNHLITSYELSACTPSSASSWTDKGYIPVIENIYDYGLNQFINIKKSSGEGFSDNDYYKLTQNINMPDVSRKKFFPLTKFVKKATSKQKFINEVSYSEGTISENNILISAKIYGYANEKETNPEQLAKQRAEVLKEYLTSKGIVDSVSIEETKVLSVGFDVDYSDKLYNTILEAKAQKSAIVKFGFYFKEAKVETDATSLPTDNTSDVFTEYSKIQSNVVSLSKVKLPDDNFISDNEYLYFRDIAEKDEMTVNKIRESVQYFNPAFHSITPEGFNARLTFLHQCTRQGPTIASSDSHRNVSTNMAFGRPPFCVLRIGDFLNIKILIDSLTIDYDSNGGTQWDLNPDGIGVQPMIANVTLGIKYLGGTDITGPISRIQNAVSSNFYANASIYEPKADYRKNWVGESGEETYEWEPLMNDEGGNVTYHKVKGSSLVQTIDAYSNDLSESEDRSEETTANIKDGEEFYENDSQTDNIEEGILSDETKEFFF